MRKNRTKHEAKKPRLAKRALALCFALIFVCSCLLPAFANSEGTLPTDPLTMVEPQQDEQQPTEPAPLNEGGTDSAVDNTDSTGSNTDSTGSGTNPTEEPKPAEQEPKADEPKNEEPKTEETKNEGTTESKDSTEEQPKNEGTTEETKPEEIKPEGTTEETKTEETKPEEPKQPTTNTTGDTINQGEATYTYRFWPDKVDAFDLEAINDAVKKGGETLNDAAQSRAGMVPCTVLTVMTNANLRDYQANVQQPTKDGYEFAGWYTVDGTTEDEFSFEQNLNFEKSETIDVFAKWNELVTLQTTVTVDVDATLFGGEAAISLADEYSYEDDRMAAPTKTLTLDVKATNLSSNSDLFVSSASSSAIEDYCDDNELVPILTLDITPKDNSGKKTEPQGTSTVTISGLSELELPDKLTMVHKKDDGEIEKIPAQYSNGTLTFKATSFSTYAVAADGWEWEPYTYNQYVYVYLKITGNTEGLVKHTNSSGNWFLIGRIPNVSLPSPDTGTYGGHKGQTAYGGKYQKAAVGALNKIERNGNGAIAARFPTAEAAKAAILANSGIDLKNVVWTGSDFGLTVDSGADGFVDGSNAWHLDGTLERKYVDSYTINYLVEGTNEKIKDSYRANATVDTVINISNDDTLKPPTITENGKTYELVTGDPADYTITVEQDGHAHGRNVINLYYRDVSKSYPLFVYARISDTVYKKLHGLTLNANQWYTLGVVDKSGLSRPTGGVVDQDKKDHTSEKYNTAVNSLNRIVRYEDNQEIDLSWVEWDYGYLVDGVSFGLTRANGADGYADTKIAKYTNADGIETTKDTLSYHLDGYIPSIGAVVINYYIKGTETPLQDSVIHYGRTGSRYTLTSSEKPSELSKDGVKYTLDESSITPADGKQAFVDNEVNTINLYYEPPTIDINITKDLTTHDPSKKFTFKVTGDGLGNEDKRILVDESGTKLTRVNGFEMTHGKTVTLKNVEAGMHVNVTEFDRYDYDVTATNYSTPAVPNKNGEKTFDYEVVLQDGKLVLVDSATKSVVADNHIIVTNTPATTSLTVTKATKKDGVADNNNQQEFEFTLTLGSESKNVTWSKNGNTGTVMGTSHEFKLKGGESITFSGINVNDTAVKVEEKDYTAQHYTTTVDDRTGHDVAISPETLKQNQTAGTTVAFVNEYTTPKLESMTIQKKVTGEFGDRDKSFTFSVTLTNANPALLSGVTHPNVANLSNFTLKHGQSVELKNIPIDTIITVTESDANDYMTSATGHSKSVTGSSARTFTYKVVDEGGEAVLKSVGTNSEGFDGTTITVTNDFDGNPDTGVLLDTLPYLILLAVAVAGGVLVVVRKRKHRDE